MASDLPVPTGLGAEGRAFWRTVAGKYEGLWPPEVALLAQICRTLDQISGLEAAVKRAGVMVGGSQGQPVLNPAVTEARLQRQQLGRLLDQLGLPTEDVGAAADGRSEATPDSPVKRRARKAAEARWARRPA